MTPEEKRAEIRELSARLRSEMAKASAEESVRRAAVDAMRGNGADVVCRTVCMADPIGGAPARAGVLFVSERISPAGLFPSADAASDFYRSQARAVLDMLDTLPSGTRHELLILLLQAKADHYRGPQKGGER